MQRHLQTGRDRVLAKVTGAEAAEAERLVEARGAGSELG